MEITKNSLQEAIERLEMHPKLVDADVQNITEALWMELNKPNSFTSDSQNNATSDEALPIAGVGTRLFGVYSPEDDLLAVHATEDGAEDNKANYEKQHGEVFYVDYVMLQP